MFNKIHRTRRFAQEIHKNLSFILQHNICDSRIGMVTISDVQISSDLSYAKIFVTFLDNATIDTIQKVNLKILKNAKGFIRNILSKKIKSRVIPELDFIYDQTLLRGEHISKLIYQSKYSKKTT